LEKTLKLDVEKRNLVILSLFRIDILAPKSLSDEELGGEKLGITKI
jgi:hypothetical protein